MAACVPCVAASLVPSAGVAAGRMAGVAGARTVAWLSGILHNDNVPVGHGDSNKISPLS